VEKSLEESWKFWEPIVTKEDGSLDVEQVKKELHDFYIAMQEVPKVYCHITGNRLSKILYEASVVISAADERYEDFYCDEAE
jgi:methionyl-tRNA formyltransferase